MLLTVKFLLGLYLFQSLTIYSFNSKPDILSRLIPVHSNPNRSRGILSLLYYFE
ncbi:hypothetical protein KsCSTR_44250 [Candidatus Kuenenia stuttgartiensis]|uniref:Uncharacterized protein n=1 Tax=Kuenenia stuttgartiensis TaxID=174633 RepID=Q1PWU2_KUEST|nr:hypothetical protein KsCSTR_44250 [Candidatus Kuenenia stuttgartiensis]CAJ71692.1 unknown protein [Candidatus Kuenenia stuttgartiensis]